MPSNESPTPNDPDDRLIDEASPVEEMDRADMANGENLDEESSQRSPAAAPAGNTHPTGERQASENQENDPPA